MTSPPAAVELSRWITQPPAGEACARGRRLRRSARVLVALVVASSAARLSAQSPASAGPAAITFSGHAVRPDGSPIAHVVVSLAGTSDSALTRDDGGFVLHPPRAGAYMVGVRGLGLAEKRFDVTFASGATQDMTITMTPFVPVLPRVVVTADERSAYASVGFDQRQRMGVGQFLTYDQVVRKRASTFTQLLQGMRGIVLTDGPLQSHTPGTGVRGGDGGGGCVSYVVDGTPQQMMTGNREGTNQRDVESPDNLIDVSQVGAVEVYSAAERPSGFGGTDDNMEEPPMPPDRNQTTNPQTGAASTQLNQQGSQQTAANLPREACGLVMVWTRARLGISESPDATAASVRRTAPHDITHGLAVFGHGSCNPPAPMDTMALVVYGGVQGQAPSSMSEPAFALYRDQVMTALARGSDLPSEALLPVFGLPSARGSPHGIPAANSRIRFEVAPTLATVVSFTLDTTGAVEDVHVGASSLSGTTDTSAMALIEQTAAAHAFPRLSGQQIASDSIQLYLVVEGDEAAAGVQAAVLGQVEVPVWRLTKPAHLVSGAPKADKKNGTRDSVTVTMVVDSAGHVANGTARFEVADQGSPSAESRTHVLQMLPALRFDPAQIGSCRVSSLVTQSFGTGD